jgi:Flp pilus assembly protein TadG
MRRPEKERRHEEILIVALVVALAVTFVHDLGEYVSARRAVVEGARDAADVAAGLASTGRDAAARAAADKALERGVTVYLYDQDGTRVEVWAKIEVDGTWVYAPVTAFIEGRPADQLPVLEYYASAPIR